MVSAVVYIKGGAKGPHSKNLTVRCQAAFHKLLDAMGFEGRKPKLVACGGRQNVYDRFCTAHRVGQDSFVAMWIDSEEAMRDVERAWQHLAEVKTVSVWERPTGAEDEQVLFMTTCMEGWILADKASLESHYKGQLDTRGWPAVGTLEKLPREEAYQKLKHATRDCKAPYLKGELSYKTLEAIKPAALRKLSSFNRAERILEARLHKKPGPKRYS